MCFEDIICQNWIAARLSSLFCSESRWVWAPLCCTSPKWVGTAWDPTGQLSLITRRTITAEFAKNMLESVLRKTCWCRKVM